MSDRSLSHVEITDRFLKSNAINPEALGKFVADNAIEFARSDEGVHGALIGKFNMLACMWPGPELNRSVGDLQRLAAIREVMGVE